MLESDLNVPYAYSAITPLGLDDPIELFAPRGTVHA
jgi:hypothetical protein